MEHEQEQEEKKMLKKLIGVPALLIAINVILVTTHAMAAPSRVFVTSTTYQGGGFGGFSGADTICNQRAAAASLGGTYTAWLSDSTTDAADRVYHNSDGYINTNNVMVANNWAALINADNVDLLATIEYDEDGNSISTEYAWTGTFETGLVDGSHCLNWGSSDSGQDGTVGLADDDGRYWSEYVEDGCNFSNHLYCFQNEPPPPPPAVSVPTMNEWGVVILALLIAGSAVWFLRRRKMAI
ncbi:MAG: IPTL-CTERM sorting domain-containing protein [Deltaproteobacteria bacterium]|nr:IPTL-CTERM sorting domain-containing protein [Deltaproteobacteria bacterium]MBW1939056.1 IPTL-CTERM sorting domain-containing protein [Deltaproteobacteria bacterium]MBW1964465.1 IPTL-CTERM sorting domain-containing protein [Deltaproteobacteria bacterium]MBW2349946.1 IPTL-CTERM sorting domain-containing protein [Deltaproteobacteria bacterium]